MQEDWQLKAQAFVDGELDEAELREVASLIARDADVGALVRELKHTRQALKDAELVRPVPETREFYWSKIAREIERMPQGGGTPRERRSPFSALLRWMVPVGGAAALAVGGFYFAGGGAAPAGTQWQAGFAGVSAFTYYDHQEGMTMMWLSYPSGDTVAFNP